MVGPAAAPGARSIGAKVLVSLRSPSTLINLAVLAWLSVACDPRPAAPRFITDSQGRALILHGTNVSSSAKFTPDRLTELGQDEFDRLSRDWGFNLVRLVLSWDALEPEPGVYGETWLDEIARRVDWCAEAGLWVVLDMHQDTYGPVDSDGRLIGGNGHPAWAFLTDGLPFTRREPFGFNYFEPAVVRAFDNFWDYSRHPELQDGYAGALARLARRFRDHPAVLGYDIMNEPWAGTLANFPEQFDTGPYAAFLERMIAAIRTADADKWIFYEPRAVGPNDGAPSYIPVLDDPREGEDRLVYAPHFYSFLIEGGASEEGTYNAEGNVSHERWQASRKAEIDAQRAPLLIGEFGARAGTLNIEAYMRDTAEMADRLLSGWAHWSYDRRDAFSPVDAEGKERPYVNELVRVYPQRIAGEPEHFEYDADRRRLILSFFEKPGVTGPTEIYVPETRFFPEGFRFWTSDPDGGWRSEWDAERELLSYWADPGEPHHILVVRPDALD
jgi:endoglycosylceramidase